MADGTDALSTLSQPCPLGQSVRPRVSHRRRRGALEEHDERRVVGAADVPRNDPVTGLATLLFREQPRVGRPGGLRASGVAPVVRQRHQPIRLRHVRSGRLQDPGHRPGVGDLSESDARHDAVLQRHRRCGDQGASSREARTLASTSWDPGALPGPGTLIIAGDGGPGAFDPGNPNRAFVSTQWLDLFSGHRGADTTTRFLALDAVLQGAAVPTARFL